MPHPDEGLIHAWLDGELDAAEAARVEALVARDPEWAAAAVDARGLIAASSRIVGALDEVSANVIPKARPAHRAPRWWMARVAALVVIVAGTTIVLREGEPDRAMREAAWPKVSAAPLPHAGPPVTKIVPAPAPVAGARQTKPLRRDLGNTDVSAALRLEAKPLADAGVNALAAGAPPPQIGRRLDTLSQKYVGLGDSSAARGRSRMPNAESAQLARGFVAGAVASPESRKTQSSVAASAAKVAARDQAADRAGVRLTKAEKDAAPPPAPASLCFEVRRPVNAGTRLLRLDSAQLADSLRLEKLTVRGDTLRSVTGHLLAVRISCPGP